MGILDQETKHWNNNRKDIKVQVQNTIVQERTSLLENIDIIVPVQATTEGIAQEGIVQEGTAQGDIVQGTMAQNIIVLDTMALNIIVQGTMVQNITVQGTMALNIIVLGTMVLNIMVQNIIVHILVPSITAQGIIVQDI